MTKFTTFMSTEPFKAKTRVKDGNRHSYSLLEVFFYLYANENFAVFFGHKFSLVRQSAITA